MFADRARSLAPSSCRRFLIGIALGVSSLMIRSCRVSLFSIVFAAKRLAHGLPKNTTKMPSSRASTFEPSLLVVLRSFGPTLVGGFICGKRVVELPIVAVGLEDFKGTGKQHYDR